jgi:hypothetical protein
VRVIALALVGLLGLASVVSAGEGRDDDTSDVTVTVVCRDGQTPVGDESCDIDDHVDGTCTFGKRDGKSIKVRVGKSVSVANSCGAVGTCVARRRADAAGARLAGEARAD